MLAGSKDYNLIVACFGVDKEIRRIGIDTDKIRYENIFSNKIS